MPRSLLAAIALLAALCAGVCGAQTSPPAPAATTGSGVWYEIFVRAFADSNGDGIGDLNGVTARLDYLQSLGVDGLWLLPIHPSPSYHGYDVTDYESINPQYGNEEDFQRLLAEAHRRGMRVIIDFVANHTSSRHPWFQAARDPSDPHHAWYVWAGPGTDLKARSATGGPAWHALDGQHYLGVFTAEMPDLDYDTPAVRTKMIRIGRHWLEQGVDGYRLDAAQHIYFDFAAQRGDPNVAVANVRWWREFRDGIEPARPHAYLVGEATEATLAQLPAHLGPLDAIFDFPLATRLLESVKQERDRGILAQAVPVAAAYAAAGRPAGDATFLSNHDQTRVMTQLRGHAGHARVAAALLMTLPGEPYVYYGEELGLEGRKPDPDLREPMRWNRRTDAPGESRWKRLTANTSPQVSVEAEEADPNSLLNRYRLLIHWRAELPALRHGDLVAFDSGDPQLVAFVRAAEGTRLLVVHNLSGHSKRMTLDPSRGFSRLLRQTAADTGLADGTLTLPPYASAILE